MSKYVEGRHLSELQADKTNQIVFWTRGNFPTQQVEGLTEKIVLENFKLLYLLSGTILASTSYYFESPITQSVTLVLKDFFEDGSAVFFFDEDLDGPTDHAKSKIAKSPDGTTVYKDRKKILSDAKKLENLGDSLVRRENVSISDKMVGLWIEDILSTDNYSIGFYINKEITIQYQQEAIKTKLIEFAKRRDKDFVWEFIQPTLISCGLTNEKFHIMARKRLSQMYSLATARTLSASLDKKVSYSQINQDSKHDTYLFSICLNQLGILDKILAMRPNELKALKNSTEFGIFRNCYFKLIDDLSYDPSSILPGISLISTFEESYAQKGSDAFFVQNFLDLVEKCHLPKEKFQNSIDEIKNIIEKFNIFAVNKFVEKVKSSNFDNNSKEKEELVFYKLKEYKQTAIKNVIFYSLFLLAGAFIFSLDRFFDEFSWKNLRYVKNFAGSVIFFIPFIRSFFNHGQLAKYFLFLISKKEQKRIRIEITNNISN
ncbi:MAG: hypothetical protein LBK03_08220 [Bacteroidales bacterium]|jgi:hypothetical protein|nr:hypothetical protein [Bacteroidales bacterium]